MALPTMIMETHRAEVPAGAVAETIEVPNSRLPTGLPTGASIDSRSVPGDASTALSPVKTSHMKSARVKIDPFILMRRKVLEDFKESNKQRKRVFKKVVKKHARVIGVMRKELSSMLKKNRVVAVTRFPRDHYCNEQINLVIYDFLRKLESRTLSYEHIRENIENLFYIQDFIDITTPHCSSNMAVELGNLLTIVEEVANIFEQAANQSTTVWSSVRNELKIGHEPKPVDPQTMIPMIGNFKQAKLLGAGGFGAVYKAFYCKTLACTVKLVPITKFRSEKHACVDKVTASVVSHPFLVKYFATFTTLQAFVTVMEYIRGIDLHKIVKAEAGLDEVTARIILFQLGEAVLHMHSRGFIHRDIKPSNMMVLPGCRVKLIDLDTIKISLANFVSRESQFYFERSATEFRDKETAGTVPFLSPEVLKSQPYGRAIDWWAVGVTAFNLSFAKIPFRGEKKSKEFRELVSSGPIPFPKDKAIPPLLKQFIEDCLVRKPSQRLCSVSNAEFRGHNFFSELDAAGVYAGTFVHELDSIYAELEECDGRWSPPGVKAKEEQRVTLEISELTDSENQLALYTYASQGFQMCIKYSDRRGGLTAKDRESLEEELEENARVSNEIKRTLGYRFQNCLQQPKATDSVRKPPNANHRK